MTRQTVLVDTGPLYTLADRSDQYHTKAIHELVLLQLAGYRIALLFPTLMESYTLVMRYLGVKYAHRWLGMAMEGCGLLNPTPDDYSAASHLVSRYSDQKITLFDATIATISQQLRVPVWTFDSDFDVLGSNLWRS